MFMIWIPIMTSQRKWWIEWQWSVQKVWRSEFLDQVICVHVTSKIPSRKLDSSGFEHVFVGETRNKAEVIGFHNWIQFYLQEKRGFVDYKGFFPSRRKRHVSAEEESKNQLITIQFSWKGDVKPIGSSFIGTSPEFEMALYTVCYLAGEGEDVQVEIDDYDVTVKAHHMGPYMGSCYPKCWQYWHLYYLVIMNLINLK